MRVGEELMVMDDTTQRNILLEPVTDFSAQIVPDLTMDDFDRDALIEMQRLYSEKHHQPTEIHQLLIDWGLQTSKGYTYAALILLGSKVALRTHLANAEIIFQYRNNKDLDLYQDREDYRNAFLLEQQNLWAKIISRNQITQIQEGFLTKEIPAFNEKVIKEAILNAVTHRDYRDPGSIIIKQSPQEFEIQSPGGLLPGVTIDNILIQTKPRNRLIAEVLQHLGFVQRAGQGMDTIFRETIHDGKVFPDLSESDTHQVALKVPAQIKNDAFIKYLERLSTEKQLNFSLNDLIDLQSLESGAQNLDRDQIQKFLDMGIIEKAGRTKATKYLLSHHYYKSQGTIGEYTRLAGLSRDVKKQLILSHLAKNNLGSSLNEIAQAFPEMPRQNVSNLLQELKTDNKIVSKGHAKKAKWKLDLN
jgi:ATP-dependent DNA helicase RecG